MDSFFLSETLVYLYLAMAPADDVASSIPWSMGASIFTTEGHIFPLQGRPPGGEDLLALSHRKGEVLFPAAVHGAPMATCEALSPFERVAVQQRCRTKYLLTPSYQLQMIAETTRRCRPQIVTLLVWPDGASSDTFMVLSGLASSLGRPVAALPLLHLQLRDKLDKDMVKSAAKPMEGLDTTSNRNESCSTDDLTGLERAERPLPSPALSLLRLDLEQSPGRMPFFSSTQRLEPLRQLFATRTMTAAEPLNACSDLQLPPNREQTLEEAYAGRLVLISRGGCLFVQKLLRAQQAGAAGVIMINSETYDERLQVMTCPNQERGGGSEVRIPAAMISWNDGQQLLQKLHGSAVAATLFTPYG